MANGTARGPNMNGAGSTIDLEPTVSAEPYTNGTLKAPHPFRGLCARIRNKISGFLEEKTEDEVLKSVQIQTKESLATLQEALSRYRYAPPFPFPEYDHTILTLHKTADSFPLLQRRQGLSAVTVPLPICPVQPSRSPRLPARHLYSASFPLSDARCLR